MTWFERKREEIRKVLSALKPGVRNWEQEEERGQKQSSLEIHETFTDFIDLLL